MKIIFCKFFKKFCEGHDEPFYPGRIGEYIYKNISKLAWKKWMHQQTKIINEKKLNMMNIQDYQIIKKEMIKFLFKKDNITY
ncbi:oxidative damage protection protein [Buchnera aphidicola]|uniref:Oxidative damage protection protein n=1 Tax=Buchnera aphidicola (Stegophylla sp.) TaxID=2315800 RepID=A0A4D6Y9T4_9GAMM|nr:oxidative damage protection protein [Buchnera aphidicola (Stegophylla sp.)]QCI26507.1 oxidative damage protection protein [Buchnera aphidicola (Stegophylla sp.)]